MASSTWDFHLKNLEISSQDVDRILDFYGNDQTIVAGEELWTIISSQSEVVKDTFQPDFAFVDERCIEAHRALLEELGHLHDKFPLLWSRYTQIKQIRSLLAGLGEVGTNDSWRIVRDYNGIRTSIRQASDYAETFEQHPFVGLPATGSMHIYDEQVRSNRMYSIILEGDVNLEFFPFLSLLNEADWFTAWVPSVLGLGLNEAQILERGGRCDFTFRGLIGLPQPFAPWKMVFNIVGHDCMTERDEQKQVVILLNSVSEAREQELVEAHNAETKRRLLENSDDTEDIKAGLEKLEEVQTAFNLAERAELGNSAIVIRPILKTESGENGKETTRSGGCYVQLYLNILPRMKALPEFLIDVAFANLAFLIVEQIREAVSITQKAGYLDRQRNPQNDFYHMLRRRIGESLPWESTGPAVPIEDLDGKKSDSSKNAEGGDALVSKKAAVSSFVDRRVTLNNCEIGMRVRRGLGWHHGEEDLRVGIIGGFGRIISINSNARTAEVEWDYSTIPASETWVGGAFSSMSDYWMGYSDKKVKKGHYRLGPLHFDLAIFNPDEDSATYYS